MMRRCWDCGNVGEHASDVVPGVCCPKCGSQDTRLLRRQETLHLGRITVGEFLNPTAADLECESIEQAMIEASTRARAARGTAIAIWEADDLLRVYISDYALRPTP